MPDYPTIQAFAARCVCGRPFTILPETIGQHVVCPSCNRVLIPVVAEPVSGIRLASTAPDSVAPIRELKECPACGKPVVPAENRCRHCGEKLTIASASPVATDQAGSTTAPVVDDSPVVFVLRLSQWDNFWKYVTCLMVEILAMGMFLVPQLRPWAPMIVAGISCVVVITVFFIFLHARMTRCIISENRIETQKGIFTRQIDWVSLNCVLDIQLHQGFVQRLLGVGTIAVRSTDKITPLLEVPHVPRANQAFEFLQQQLNRRSKILSLIR